MEEGMTEERKETRQGIPRQDSKESMSEAACAGWEWKGSASEAGRAGREWKESASEAGRASQESEGHALEGTPEVRVCAGSLLEAIRETFPGKCQDIRSYSGLALAYIGDVVYDLIIRTVVVSRGSRPVNDLHRITVGYVSANAQSRIVQALTASLTEEEQSVYRRGKNSKPHTTAKNASAADYLRATGFEAVLGYLYLKGDMERALHLVKEGIALAGMEL